MRTKFKLFKWESEYDVVSLEGYIDELAERGWVCINTTEIKGGPLGEVKKVIITCAWDEKRS